MNTFKGRVLKLGDNINTDLIVQGKYLKLSYKEAAKYVLEGVDYGLNRKIRPGDILVAGRNFGTGSSREAAPAALKYAGIAAVIAQYFSRIFYRNAINIGLPVLECSATNEIQENNELEIVMEKGLIKNCTLGKSYKITEMPELIIDILKEDGLLSYLEKYNSGMGGYSD